jgi:hypothetical protein
MRRRAAPVAFMLCLVAGALLAGCAAPGEPVARHPVIPAAVTDLTARQYGNAVALNFAIPTRSTDRDALSEHPAIEIYSSALPNGSVPDKKTSWRLAFSIPPEQADRYLKGERIEFRAPVTPDDLTRAGGALMAYKIRTSAVKARESADSNVVTLKVYAPPETPRNVRVDVTESALVVSWDAAAPPVGTGSFVYRVYRGVLDKAQETPPTEMAQANLKAPLEMAGSASSTEFRDANFDFGMPYLYTIRSVVQYGADSVESADSSPAIVTPRDTFPPAAPTGLEVTTIPAAGPASSSVELSWAINSERDLAGYHIYRSDTEDGAGQRLNMEILPSPTFRDMSVASGRRYSYRVSAVDRAGNESLKSSAVQVEVP